MRSISMPASYCSGCLQLPSPEICRMRRACPMNFRYFSVSAISPSNSRSACKMTSILTVEPLGRIEAPASLPWRRRLKPMTPGFSASHFVSHPGLPVPHWMAESLSGIEQPVNIKVLFMAAFLNWVMQYAPPNAARQGI